MLPRLLVCGLCRAEARAGLLVLRPWRAEYIEHAAAFRPGAHGVRHIAGRAPEIALLHLDLLAALDTDRRTFQQHAPLLLGMMMQGALRMRLQNHHREHRLLAGKDAGRDAGHEFAEQAVDGIIEIVEFVALTHRS